MKAALGTFTGAPVEQSTIAIRPASFRMYLFLHVDHQPIICTHVLDKGGRVVHRAIEDGFIQSA